MARHSVACPTSPMRRRLAATVLALVGVAGLGLASAAQLNVNSRSLGAGTVLVASCQTSGAITVSFTTAWAATPTPAAYRASAVRLTGIDYACNGGSVKVQIVGPAPAVAELPGTITGVPTTGNGTVTLTIPGATYPTAASITSVAVVIQK